MVSVGPALQARVRDRSALAKSGEASKARDRVRYDREFLSQAQLLHSNVNVAELSEPELIFLHHLIFEDEIAQAAWRRHGDG